MPNNRRTEGISISSLPLRPKPRYGDKLYIFGYNDQNVLQDWIIEYKDLINPVENIDKDLRFTAIINGAITRGLVLLDAVGVDWEIYTIVFEDDLNLLTITFRDKEDGTVPNFINKRLYLKQGSNAQVFIINNSHMVGRELRLTTTVSWANSSALFHFTHVTNALGSATTGVYARPVLWYRGTSTQPTTPTFSWGEYGLGDTDLGDWVDDPSKLEGTGTVNWIAYGSAYNNGSSWSTLTWIVKRASANTYVQYSVDGVRREAGHYPPVAADQYVRFIISGSIWSPWIKFRGLPDEYTQLYSSALKLTAYTGTLTTTNILPFDVRMYSTYKIVFEWVSSASDPTTDTAISEAVMDRSILDLGNNNAGTYTYGRTIALYWSILYNGAANFGNVATRQNTLAAADSVQMMRLNLNRASGDTTSSTVGQMIFYDPGLINEDGYVYILGK